MLPVVLCIVCWFLSLIGVCMLLFVVVGCVVCVSCVVVRMLGILGYLAFVVVRRLFPAVWCLLACCLACVCCC